MATKGELTVRQETFCQKFLGIGEATEAYRQSGYKHENYSDKSLGAGGTQAAAVVSSRRVAVAVVGSSLWLWQTSGQATLAG